VALRDRERGTGAAVGLADLAAFEVDDGPATLPVELREMVAGLAGAIDRVGERRLCVAGPTGPELRDPGHGAADLPPRRLGEASELVSAAACVPREEDVAGHVPMDRSQGGDTGVDRRIGVGGRPRAPGPFSRVDPAVEVVEPAGVDADPGARETEARIGGDLVRRKSIQPLGNGADLPPLQERVPAFGDEIGRRAELTRSRRVPDRGLDRARPAVPGGGASVELRDHVGIGAVELVEQQVPEEVVVAVPLARGVEWLQEEVRALQLLEQAVRADGVDNGVAERARQLVQDRGVQEEVAHVVGLTIEHLGA
jgi:hypothetical protein